MKNFNLIIGLLFIITVAISCNMTPEFKEFKSEAGRFSINAPGDMKEQTQDVPSAAGNLKMVTHTADLGNRAFLVSYNDYPEDVNSIGAQELLDEVQKGAVGGIGGTITSEKNIEMNGNPGKEYVANIVIPKGGGDGVAKSHIYLVKNRLYQVLVIAKKSEANSSDVDKFLNSFKITAN
ncbi:MAG: hypothetical protein H7Z37_17230 [Pyrinomonadaceae bacterium]|nr:hypothetical protein [Pyrinomonadaceae bacterium]